MRVVVGITRISADGVAELLVRAVSTGVTCPPPFEEVVCVVDHDPDLERLRKTLELRLSNQAADWRDHVRLSFHPV